MAQEEENKRKQQYVNMSNIFTLCCVLLFKFIDLLLQYFRLREDNLSAGAKRAASTEVCLFSNSELIALSFCLLLEVTLSIY